jgi:AcrR family transcriptional regulator
VERVVERVLTAKGAATRARIIGGAAEVIRSRGVAETGLDDIRAATATSKSQLFHYFPDGRAQLFAAVARHEAELVLSDQQPYLDDLSSWAVWQAWRDRVVERYEQLGQNCPLAALTGQLDRSRPETRAIVADLVVRWHALLADGVRALQGTGGVATHVDPEAAASSVLAAVQGGVLILQATGDIRHLERALDAALAGLAAGAA